MFSTSVGEACQSCNVGQYRPSKQMDGVNSTDPTTCLGCPVGQVMPFKGATKCIDCIPGQFQDQEGNESCIECASGRKFNASIDVGISASNCVACDKGQHQPEQGTTFCLPCLELFKTKEAVLCAKVVPLDLAMVVLKKNCVPLAHRERTKMKENKRIVKVCHMNLNVVSTM
jgi:hypothetical protein